MKQAPEHIDHTRRRIVKLAAYGAGFMATGSVLAGCAQCGGDESGNVQEDTYAGQGLLLPPDANGIMLPEGFQSRVVARSGTFVADTGFTWHGAPDGGACFPTSDGWIYVSNAELIDGGVSALRFDLEGNIIDAYSILHGTQRNCAGGPTPWGTWLSCEEIPDGRVWECDPHGIEAARVYPALGVFNHEAAAVDPDTLQVYLTEDRGDGCLYRFTPASVANGRPDLSNGLLEVAEVVGDGPVRTVAWHEVPDPSAASMETRLQLPQATAFARGEGAWFHGGELVFCTTGDDRIYGYRPASNGIRVLYDVLCHPDRLLTGNDNITVGADGSLLIAEDGGNMQIVTLGTDGELAPLLQIPGHLNSEITGPAFSPDGTRLYFSSQRGSGGTSADGITYEIAGPFRGP